MIIKTISSILPIAYDFLCVWWAHTKNPMYDVMETRLGARFPNQYESTQKPYVMVYEFYIQHTQPNQMLLDTDFNNREMAHTKMFYHV